MKTKTITLHAIDNCGSGLQAYALQQMLIQNGVDNEIIDYRPIYGENNSRPIRYFVKKIIFSTAMKKRKQVFEQFIQKYLCLTQEQYYKYEQLEKGDLQADAFIAGSDQIWNDTFPCGRDLAFYLEFVKRGKKISYAASAGRKLEQPNEIKQLSDRVKMFDAISVRENSTEIVLEQSGITAKTVCDPVLLHDRKFYEKLVKDNLWGNYILVYLVPRSKMLNEILKELKVRYNYKVIYVGSFLNRCVCDVNLTGVGPEEFLTLIANAKYIIAGSFHATVFSCVFHKKFLTLPYANNERMKEFLEKVGAKERFVEGVKVEIDTEIEWKRVDRCIERMRSRSKKWILQELGIAIDNIDE